ncbi:hypothetical protein EII34_14940 [Arachnia propionica]|uniref:Uncharacterized protein n=1 Tax=Arachnia propionica TaxID=1750 RepID=A0A3P1T196_9ACTN|nr:helix-turn-helix domain-containing protein [Arachnia propionica]RRD03201.1 hypothetical protein EII34_14940 [Arachnia propionica]
MTATDRHPDCRCPQAVHVHGTSTTYVVHRCRCDLCRAATTERAAKRRRAQAYGRYDRFVDGDQVRAHLRSLMAAGMGWKRIAAAAGVAPSTVYPILYGRNLDDPTHPQHRPPRTQVTREVAEKLLAVAPELAEGALVDATGTRRRIQALAAIGWTLAELGDRLGIRRSNMRLHKPDLRHVTEGTRRAVVALYDELWDQPPAGPSGDRMRAWAASLGWVPPMAWDDDRIDDPRARAAGGLSSMGRRRADLDEAVRLLAQGESRSNVASRLGISLRTLQRHLSRSARHDEEVAA